MDEAQAPSKKKIKLMHVFKHPKFYRIPRDKAISPKQSTDRGGRAPTVESCKRQASSHKLQAASDKLQALGEAASSKR